MVLSIINTLSENEKIELFLRLLNRTINYDDINLYIQFFNSLIEDDQLYYIKAMINDRNFDFINDYYFNTYFDLSKDHLKIMS